MFVVDFSAMAKKSNPVRNVRIGPGSRTLAATLGAEGLAAEAVWWDLAANAPLGTSAIFPPVWEEYGYPEPLVEPVFTPDLARCAVHAYAAGSGSMEFHGVVVVAPGVSFNDGVGFPFCEDFTEESLEALTISPDGRWLLAGHLSGRLTRFDLRKATFDSGSKSPPDGEPISLVQDPEDEWDEWDANDAPALAVSPDGNLLATGHADGEVRLFRFRTRKQLAVLRPPDKVSKTAGVRSLEFSADGTRLAARSAGRVTIFDVAGRRPVVDLTAGDPTSFAFHPDGKRLLTGGPDEWVRVWDAATWAEVGQYDWRVGPVHAVAVSPDGLLAAAGGENRRAVVWDFGG